MPQGPGADSPTLTQGIGVVEAPSAEVEVPERLGSALEEFRDRSPIITFEFNPEPPEAKLHPQIRALLEEEARKPHVKHHIFSREFEPFFKRKGIKIHRWVLVIPLEDHLRIHRGERGGPWNADWRGWIKAYGPTATEADIYRHAGEMIFRFCLTGTLMSYYCSYALPKLPPTNPVPPVSDDD